MPTRTLLPLLLAIGCTLPTTPAVPAPPPAMELRTYDVPAGAAQEAVSLLNAVIPNTAGGRARLGPDGRVVVVADASVQAGVGPMLSQLAAANLTPTPRVKMDVWLVFGVPAEDTSIPRSLHPLTDTLTELVQAQTPMTFTLVEALSIRGESGEHAEAEGLRLKMEQTVSVRGDVVVADLNLQPRGGGKIETRVQLQPGQILVLGETGVDPSAWQADAPTGSTGPLMLYYIVRPTIEGVSGRP